MVYLQHWHGWCHMKLLPCWCILCTPYKYPPYLCTPHSSLPSDIGFTPCSPPPYLYSPYLYPHDLCTPHSSLPSDTGFTPYSPPPYLNPPYLYPHDLCTPYSSLPSLTLASLCPTYMLISSGPFTLQNSKMNPLKKNYIIKPILN